MIGVENSDEGQIIDYDRMIRIIYLLQLNAQIEIIYLPSQKTTLTSALLGTFRRRLLAASCNFCLPARDRAQYLRPETRRQSTKCWLKITTSVLALAIESSQLAINEMNNRLNEKLIIHNIKNPPCNAQSKV